MTAQSNAVEESKESKRCSLYFTEGSSDKEYHGELFQSVLTGKNFSGVLPQLLNAISESEVARYINDPNWMLQLKFDGERRMLSIDAYGAVTGINRKGFVVALPQNILNVAQSLHQLTGFDKVLTLDGEIVGNKLYVWDVLEIGGQDIRYKPASQRFIAATWLGELLTDDAKLSIEVCQSGRTSEEKRNLLNAYQKAGLEGVTFKDVSAPYVSGRPSSGGTQVKFKFWESCTLEVSMVNAQRSVAVQGYDAAGAAVPLGNVTIPPNKAVPAVGDGSIVQPEFLGVRLDQDKNDCTLAQLKLKADEAVAMKKLIRP